MTTKTTISFLLGIVSLVFNVKRSHANQFDIPPTIGKIHNQVVELTDKTFDEFLTDPANGLWFVKFYAPWCGHCQQLAPILDKVAPYLKGKMAIGKIDCTRNKKTCAKRFQVQGYPTMKIYRDGDFFEFPGERHADSIIEFGEKMAAFPIQEVKGWEEAYKMAKEGDDGVAFLAYEPKIMNKVVEKSDGDEEDEEEDEEALADVVATEEKSVDEILQSSTLLQVLKQVARNQQAFATFGFLSPDTPMEEVAKFGLGTEKAFLAKIEPQTQSILFQNTTTSMDSLLYFVKQNNHALVTELGPSNFRTIGMLGKRVAIGVIKSVPPEDEVDDEDGSAAKQKEVMDGYLEKLNIFAREGPRDVLGEFNMAWMDGRKWGKFISQFDIDCENEEETPQMFVLHYEDKEYWQNATVSARGFESFLRAVMRGEVDSKKSEEHGGGFLGMLTEVLEVYERYMPWSVLLMAAIFIGAFLLFLPPAAPDEDDLVLLNEMNEELQEEREKAKAKKENGKDKGDVTAETNETKKEK